MIVINRIITFNLRRNIYLKLTRTPMSYRARMERGSANERTSPKRICNLGASSFSEIVDYSGFVDKTLFIKAFLEADDEVIVAFAPRRFGKSINMDMLKEFLTGNKKLFQDNQLKIWKEERDFFDRYCQENPVIHVNFLNISVLLKSVIVDAFRDHRYLIKKIDGKYCWSDTKLEKDLGPIEEYVKYWKTDENLSRDDVINGFKFLSRCLHVYHNKPVYVLIDEFDYDIMAFIVFESTSENDILDETIDVIGRIMSTTFKNNEHIKKGLIVGRVRVAEVLTGHANNIQFYQFLRKPIFAPYFGFTDTEVKSLLEKEEFAPFNNDQVKKWYNGYKLTDSDDSTTIYSDLSVLRYLWDSRDMKKPCFEGYWAKNKLISCLKHLFQDCLIHELTEDLIDGEEIEIKAIQKFAKEDIIALRNLRQKLKSVDPSDAHLFFQFLAENGYLNIVRTSTENQTITVRIPNYEIRTLFWRECYGVHYITSKHWFLNENIENYLLALESVLTSEDKNVFIEYARAVSKLFDGGAIMPKNENEFYCVLFVLADNIKYFTNRRSSELSIFRRKSKERPPHLDLLMILNEAGLIVELKFADQSSVTDLSQIRTRQYDSSFDNYKNLPKKILMGLHMTKERKVSLTYTINDSPPETVTSHE